jgi:hypothetical protein
MTSLVYVRGRRGPEAEKWPGDAPAGVKQGKRVIAAFDLPPDEIGLSIDELTRRHPLTGEAAALRSGRARHGD